MNTKRMVALIVAAVLLLFSLGINTLMSILTTDFKASFDSVMGGDMLAFEEEFESGDSNERIVRLEVDGALLDSGETSLLSSGDNYNHQAFLQQLDTVMEDDSIAAVLLVVNSPGGGMIESDAIHRKLMEIKAQDKPIYVSMGSMAASGGYYISTPADKIFAYRETITGSIGVILQAMNLSGLMEKVGITYETITSGEHKDMFSSTRPSTEEEIAMLQELVDDSFTAFVDVVAQGRNMSTEQVRKLADGRLLGGKQALEAGFIDEIGDEEQALAAIRADFDLQDASYFGYTNNAASWSSWIGMKVGTLFQKPTWEQELSGRLPSVTARLLYMYE